jgi:hypothetical protein
VSVVLSFSGAEAAGPVKDTKLRRITETAKGLWGVYALFSIGCFGLLSAACSPWMR